VRAGVIALGLPILCAAGDIQKPAILWERALGGDVYGSALAGDTVVLLTLEPRASRWTVQAHDASSGTLGGGARRRARRSDPVSAVRSFLVVATASARWTPPPAPTVGTSLVRS
jgi:hypothetical protein